MSVSDWKLADVWETVADRLPDAPALVHGSQRRNWRDFDRSADGIARTLLDCGLREQDKVAQYLYNGVEYLESMFAAFKAGFVPVNTNYRYGEDELLYLFDNSDAAAVVFHGTFVDRVDAIRARVPNVRCWLWVDDASGPCPDWAVPYAAAAAATVDRVVAPWGRSADHLFFLYTGGTTGMPKGVMWRQDDLLSVLNRSATRRYPETGNVGDVRAALDSPGFVHLCACPLMHGTGVLSSISALDQGGAVVTLPSRTFHAEELLDVVTRERAQSMAIVGDAFGRPIADALDAHPTRWDISSLVFIMSSGVRWSDAVKDTLLRHHPSVMLVDTLGSSEAVGVARSVTRSGANAQRGRFSLGPRTRVITDDGRDVVAGSGEIGLVANIGRGPIGYYKDPEKSARTFPVIDGQRATILGDFATVEADGTVTLLGRGSACINTAGEKVFPEEVEDVIRTHPSVNDVAVVGVADPKYGEMVCALVEARPGAIIDGPAIVAHVKAGLAGYKAPKHVLPVDSVSRGPNGKLDYRALKDLATELLAGR
ncbi:MAG TPA: AMP-binding protein [Acidimicrobiales bacterium]|nr:AMP-binding protein [Acidimicrobiales bacterium]